MFELELAFELGLLELEFELLELLSELESARRSLGRSGSLSTEVLLEVLLVFPEDRDCGCERSIGWEAEACSSGEPSRIIVITVAR